MGRKTKIAWTHHTFNPWRGCAKVSAGCDNCYAERMARRNPKVLGTWGHGCEGVRVLASDAYWKLPLRWNRAALAAGLEGDARPRVFCGSVMDWAEERHDLIEPRRRLFDTIDATQNLIWMLLTKRTEAVLKVMPPFWVQYLPEAGEGAYMVRENVWLGATIENQDVAADRLRHLLRVPASRRFLSIEPLLGPIELKRAIWKAIEETPMGRRKATSPRPDPAEFIHEIIIGGESGPAASARPSDVRWIYKLVAEGEAMGIPTRVKQLGSRPVMMQSPIPIRHRAGADPSEWPPELAKRAYPAKKTK